MILHLSCSDER